MPTDLFAPLNQPPGTWEKETKVTLFPLQRPRRLREANRAMGRRVNYNFSMPILLE